jgi:5-methylcytosine-specific restriction endonuclease McrA
MPIKPENRRLYPANWKLISRRIRFGRAKGRCEQCGALHGQGNLFGRGFVILATAHLNQDPTDNRRSNLKALCQRCHLNHDRQDNLRRARLTRLRKRLLRQPTLFCFEERNPNAD